jgi:hypothetical protein
MSDPPPSSTQPLPLPPSPVVCPSVLASTTPTSMSPPQPSPAYQLQYDDPSLDYSSSPSLAGNAPRRCDQGEEHESSGVTRKLLFKEVLLSSPALWATQDLSPSAPGPSTSAASTPSHLGQSFAPFSFSPKEKVHCLLLELAPGNRFSPR